MAISFNKPPKPHSSRLSIGLSAPLIYSALKMYSSAGTYNFDGKAFDSLAWAIAIAVDDWIDAPSNVTLMGLATGTVGVGYIDERTTNLVIIPAVPLMSACLEAAGLNGPLMPSLSIVVTLAIAHSVTQFGGYTGVCPTVAIGTDISKVVNANGPSLVRGLMDSMAGQKITGIAAARMANGLGMGIAALVLTGFGNGKVVGTPGPAPSTGPSFSKVA